RIACFFPRCDFVRHQASIVQSPVETLTAHDVDLRLRHVQPTAMLWGIVELDLVQDPTRFLRPERLVETGSVVGVQVVLNQPNPCRTRVMPVQQVTKAMRTRVTAQRLFSILAGTCLLLLVSCRNSFLCLRISGSNPV